jgi:hypothetical protein
MAFVLKGSRFTSASIYNVEQSVGRGGVNAQWDVKLVEYMLNHYYGVDSGSPTLLETSIARFQQDARDAGVHVAQDGRIERAFSGGYPVSKAVPTMLALDAALRKTNPIAYEALPWEVPLSALAPPAPHNPSTKTISSLDFDFSPVNGMKAAVKYSDGTLETMTVNIGPQPAPEGPRTIRDLVWEPEDVVIQYSDGTVRSLKAAGLVWIDGKLFRRPK